MHRNSEEYNPMAVNEVGNLKDPKEKKTRRELAYEWIAKYKDGSQLKQYDDEEDLVYHFGHIDQEKIVEFVLISTFKPQVEVSVSLLSGLFAINGKDVYSLPNGEGDIPLGLFIGDRAITSSWGNKAKLIHLRHIRKDFKLGSGTVNTNILYELGWEAKVDDKQEKHRIILNERGQMAIPQDEFLGFVVL